MKKLLYLVLLVICTGIIVVSCKEHQHKEHETTTEASNGAEKADLAMNDEYQCPMDCEDGKTYDKEGTCPVCKMDLKKVEKEDDDDKEDDHEGHDHD